MIFWRAASSLELMAGPGCRNGMNAETPVQLRFPKINVAVGARLGLVPAVTFTERLCRKLRRNGQNSTKFPTKIRKPRFWDKPQVTLVSYTRGREKARTGGARRGNSSRRSIPGAIQPAWCG